MTPMDASLSCRAGQPSVGWQRFTRCVHFRRRLRRQGRTILNEPIIRRSDIRCVVNDMVCSPHLEPPNNWSGQFMRHLSPEKFAARREMLVVAAALKCTAQSHGLRHESCLAICRTRKDVCLSFPDSCFEHVFACFGNV